MLHLYTMTLTLSNYEICSRSHFQVNTRITSSFTEYFYGSALPM